MTVSHWEMKLRFCFTIHLDVQYGTVNAILIKLNFGLKEKL